MKLRAAMLVFVVCCLATGGSLWAEAPLAEHLPAGSLLYAGWAGRNLPFDGSNVGQLLQEPAVGHMLAALKQSIDKMPDKNIAHLWAIGGIVWQHPTALSLMDLTPGTGEAPGVSMVLLIDLGKDRPTFAKHLDALMLNGKLKMSQSTVGQTTCRTMPTPLGPASIGYKGNIFFLAVGEGTVGKLLAVKPTVSLKNDKAFIARRKGLAGENEQMAYSVDVSKLGPKISSLVSRVAGGGRNEAGPAADKVKLVVNALGLGKITSASGSTRIVEKGLYSKARIITPAPHRGVLTLLAGGALSDADLADAPDDAILFCATKLSAAKVYAELLDVARQIEPGADKQIRRGVGQLEDELGVSISKDILGNLGDTWTLTSASSLGGLGTGTVLAVSVKDSAKLTAAIAKIEAAFRKKTVRVSPPGLRFRPPRGPRIQVLKSGKLEVHYLQGIDRDAPVAPAWAVSKNKLYIGLWPQVVVAAVENSGRKSLVRNAAFQKVRRRLSSKPATLTYIDTPAVVRSLYNLMLIGWTVGADQLPRELGLEANPKVDWLPALSKIEKYLSSEAAAVSSDAAGITVESYGSLPIVSNCMTSLLTTAPVTAAVVVPAYYRARTLAGRASSASRLKMIGIAVAMYHTEHNQSPPGLVTLVEKKYIRASMLASPVSGRRMATDAKGLPIGKSDYVYIVHNNRPRASMIRAYELPENYGGKGTNILMVNGAVMWVDMPTFKRMLEASDDR